MRAKMDTGAKDNWTLVTKNSHAGFLVGRVVVYDLARHVVGSRDGYPQE